MNASVRSRIRAAALRAVAAALPVLAACSDRATAVDDQTGTDGGPLPHGTVAALRCTARVGQRTVACEAADPHEAAAGTRASLHLLGGQGTYLRLASSGVAYDAATQVFSFNAAVQNLATLPFATADGATRHDGGVQVFFAAEPTVTGGSGSVSILNATGLGTFTASNQPYFQYGGKVGGVDQDQLGGDGILSTGEVSIARTWQLGMPSTVAAFTFTLYVATETPPGTLATAAPQVTAVSPATLTPGAAATLTGVNFNAFPAANTVTIGGVAAPVTGGTATTLSVTVPCAASGAAPVQVTQGGMTGAAFAHPLQGNVRALGVGQAAIVADAGQVACNELAATGGASRYVVAVYNTSTAPLSTTGFQVSGDGTVPVAPRAAASRPGLLRAPGAAPAATPVQPPDDAHLRVLEMNRRENRRLRARFAGDPRMRARRDAVVTADVPPATRTIRVLNLNGSGTCDDYVTVNATRVYYGGKVAIYEDDATPAGLKAAANPTMQSYYNAIGAQFNAEMEPIVRTNFGDPLLRDASTDANGVLIALFSPLINGFGGVAAFVVSCDQYPNAAGNLASNFGEYFYAYQPTATGTGYAAFTPDNWYWTIRSTFIHETKHVASLAARVAAGADFDESWLEEGTARHAEELWARSAVYNVGWKANTGYGSAAQPGSLYCDYRQTSAACLATDPSRPSLNMSRHFHALYTFMASPGMYSPFGPTAVGGSTFYATSWSLVRYAIDRYGASDAAFLTALTSSPSVGAANLAGRAGVPIEQLLGGWALAMYADDYPGLSGAGADIQVPTWNFRSIFAGMHADFGGSFPAAYPLQPQALPFGFYGAVGVPSIAGGGVAYFELSGTQTQPQLLRLEGTGGGALPPSLRVAIARLQ